MLGSKKSPVLTPGTIIIFSLLILLALQVYSYLRAPWTADVNEWSKVILLSKFAYSNRYMEIIRYYVLLLIMTASLFLIKQNKGDEIYIFFLFVFPVVYTVDAIAEGGIAGALYSGNLPIVYMLLLGFFAGQKQSVWEQVKRIVPFLTCVYLLLFLYEFADSYIRFGWVIYQNSSMMAYFAHLFWTTVFYAYVTISERKRTVWIYVLLFAVLMGAVLIHSRSWVIQAILLNLVVVFTIQRRKNKAALFFVRALMIFLLLILVFWLVAGAYLQPFLQALFDKGVEDSRSVQYAEMLGQVESYKWIFGQGMYATYSSDLYGDYTFIDNELFYMSFHYGLIFALIYFFPYLSTVFTCIRCRKYMPLCVFSACVILLWLASVNGLSVFNRIHLDVKSFLMPFLAGHIYRMAKDSLPKRGKI